MCKDSNSVNGSSGQVHQEKILLFSLKQQQLYWVPNPFLPWNYFFKRNLHSSLNLPLASYGALATLPTSSESESQLSHWEKSLLVYSSLCALSSGRCLSCDGNVRRGSAKSQQAQLFLGSDRMDLTRWASFSCFGTLSPWGCRKIGWLVLNSCNLALVLEVTVLRQRRR